MSWRLKALMNAMAELPAWLPPILGHGLALRRVTRLQALRAARAALASKAKGAPMVSLAMPRVGALTATPTPAGFTLWTYVHLLDAGVGGGLEFPRP
jgi:hypothetical protein